MEQLSNKIDRENLKLGDHIYAYRKLHSYSHHGIFVGGDRVIHFNRTQAPSEWNPISKKGEWNQEGPCKNCGLDPKSQQGVVISCVDCFLKDHTLRRYQYGVNSYRHLTNWPGTCKTIFTPDTPQDAVDRAYDKLNKKDYDFEEYNLFANNCESFAVYCKTNEKHVSEQVCSWSVLLKPFNVRGSEVAPNTK